MAKSNAERQADFRMRRDDLVRQALRNADQSGKAATLNQLRMVWERLSIEDRTSFIDALNLQRLDHEDDMHELATRNIALDTHLLALERQLAEAQAALKKSQGVATEATDEVQELRRQVEELKAHEQYHIEATKRVNHLHAELSVRAKTLDQWMTQEEYRLVLGCLHPDRQPEDQHEKYRKAFLIFKRLEERHLERDGRVLRGRGWQKKKAD